MNTIFTYKNTQPFTEEVQFQISQIDFSEVPEMRRVQEIVDPETTLVSIPYQANISQEAFDYLSGILSQYGVLEIIGKWDDNGDIIEFDLHKYRDALNDVEEFEEAVCFDGVDYTGRESEFVKSKDEEGNDIEPDTKRFIRLKSTKRPTLAQAKKIHVNVFNNEFKRKLI
jgi:hypothetical protein